LRKLEIAPTSFKSLAAILLDSYQIYHGNSELKEIFQILIVSSNYTGKISTKIKVTSFVYLLKFVPFVFFCFFWVKFFSALSE
jgi:hypothetical protein